MVVAGCLVCCALVFGLVYFGFRDCVLIVADRCWTLWISCGFFGFTFVGWLYCLLVIVDC